VRPSFWGSITSLVGRCFAPALTAMTLKKLNPAQSPFYRAEQVLRDSRLLIEGTKKLLAQSKKLVQDSKESRKRTRQVTSPLWKSR